MYNQRRFDNLSNILVQKTSVLQSPLNTASLTSVVIYDQVKQNVITAKLSQELGVSELKGFFPFNLRTNLKSQIYRYRYLYFLTYQ